MDQYVLVASKYHPDRCHQRVTRAAPVTWSGVVDVLRVETVRTVIALPTAHDRCADELLAVPTLEGLIGVIARFSQLLFGKSSAAAR